MDYEKKYKDAIEKARIWKEKSGMPSNKQGILDDIFPELKEKESEDEKIRKAIHIYLDWLDGRNKDYQPKGEYTIRDMLAWLEKQGMQKLNNKTAIESWKDMRLEVYQQASGNRHEPNYSDDSTKMFSLNDIDEIFEKIDEKQGEQKQILANSAKTCKVEPKFHEGEWVVYEGDGEKVTLQIARIVAETYEFTDESTVNVADEDTLHPWTIADARDGDVLTDNGSPFIFKCTKPSDIKTEIKNPLTVLGYCGIGGAGFTKSGGWGDTANCIYYPATKEQRDRLMKAMADAGYEFNFDKKELKKVEQKPAEDIDAEKVSEEYRNYRMSCGITDPVMLDEIESAYYEGAIRKKPTSWNEEDEKKLNELVDILSPLKE